VNATIAGRFLTPLKHSTRKLKSGITLEAFFKEARGKSIRIYRDREVIYSQGQSATSIFYIKSGIVKLTIEDKRRRKHAVLAVLTKDAIFGEGCLLPAGAARRVSTATSIGSSTIARVEKAEFLRIIERKPALAVIFIRYLISQAVLFKMDLADHRLNAGAGEKRLARALLVYGSLVQRKTTGSTAQPFSQTTLAAIVGTTRPRINEFMNNFRKQGYIRYNGGLQIDAERLMAFLAG
jgi:CRP/FNR family transcriptional regulator, cyclic AMP receptor protein